MGLFDIKNISIYNSKIEQSSVNMSNGRTTSLFELELPIENGGTAYIDSDCADITTDLFICAKPNQMRHTKFPFKCYYIHLAVLDGALYNFLSAVPTFTRIKEPDIYKDIFEDMCRYFITRNTPNEIMEHSLILKLIYTLYAENEFSFGNKTPKIGMTINKAVYYIEENLSSDLSLENVASHVSMSKIHFHNCFKEAMGKTLHEYIEEKRINKSVNLLLGTDMTLTEIAFACGFSSQSYFNYAFKRKMHTSPWKYAQDLNKNYEIN